MNTSHRWAWIAPILLYAAAALEMIIMVTPFAAYFYSVYTPLFHGFEQAAATAWLPQFFLPHLAHTKLVLFRGISWLGAILSLIGLVGFFVCAVQLYYGKFIKKQLVSGGLYGRVRHPQYLMLIIGGAGFLLLWPRFFILVTYVMMLGLYYILARHEEESIKQRYGSVTEDYLARVPMFNPFSGSRQSVTTPASRPKALTIWFLVVAVSLLLSFGLRTLAVSQLYVMESLSLTTPVTALSFRAMSDDDIKASMESVLVLPAVEALQQKAPDRALFLQINNGRSQLNHLLIDLGMTPEARDTFDLPEEGLFVVVSQLTSRDPNSAERPVNPFTLGARTKPIFIVGPPDSEGYLTVYGLSDDQFYPSFARILF